MPNADVLGPLQQAVYARLTGDVDLSADVTGVYDDVPEDAQYPYVTISTVASSPDNELGEYGRQTVVQLDVWSAYRGFAEATGILSHIERLLDRQPLPITGHSTVAVRHASVTALRDPDEDIRRITARYTVTTRYAG
jgi:hypothetical protein